MDIGTIATIITLLLSVYALTASSLRKELSLKISWTTWIYLGTILSLLIFLQFEKTISNAISYFFNNTITDYYIFSPLLQLTTKEEVFLVLLILTILPFSIFRKKLHPRQYKKFIELCHELFYEEKYTELIKIILKNKKQIEIITNRKYASAIIKDWFARFIKKNASPKELISFPDYFNAEEKGEETEINIIQKITKKIKFKIFNWVEKIIYGGAWYYHIRKNEKFSTRCEEIFQDQKFISFLATRNSELILKLMKSDIFDSTSLSAILRWSMLDTHSFLYKELIYKNLDSGVTGYLFENPERIEEWHLWIPIGESLIDYLNNLNRDDRNVDPYNRPMDNFNSYHSTSEKLYSPIYLGNLFFKKMIMSALDAKIQWHMWLYYYEYFIKGIEKNLRQENYEEIEFPTRYHYLTWEILESLTNIIETVYNNPNLLNQENTSIKGVDLEHENGSIIKSAMRCLGKCTRIIMESKSFTTYDKNYYLEGIFHTYFRLCQKEELKKHAETYLICIKYGGDKWRGLLQPETLILFLENSRFQSDIQAFKKCAELIQEIESWIEEN